MRFINPCGVPSNFGYLQNVICKAERSIVDKSDGDVS